LGERKLNLLMIQQCSKGFLVGPDNEKELTLAIAILLRDESYRRNIGIAARETILDRLTPALQAENPERIHRESIAGARRPVVITQSGNARKPQNVDRGT
jgi:hypothetical protein